MKKKKSIVIRIPNTYIILFHSGTNPLFVLITA